MLFFGITAPWLPKHLSSTVERPAANPHVSLLSHIQRAAGTHIITCEAWGYKGNANAPWKAMKNTNADLSRQRTTQKRTSRHKTGSLCPSFLSFLYSPFRLFSFCRPVFIFWQGCANFTWSLDLHDVLVQVLTLLHHFVRHVVHGHLPLCVSFQALLRQADVLRAARGGAASPGAAAAAAPRAAGIAQLTGQILVPGVQLRRDLQGRRKHGIRRCHMETQLVTRAAKISW